MPMHPYPAYRPSGVEWLGDVPEHWEVDRLKWSIAGKINGVWGDEPDGENDMPCIRVADFDRRQFRVNFNEPTERAITLSQRSGRELRSGDLLLEKSGGGEKQMVGCVVLFDHEEAAVCSNFIARLQMALGQDARFWTFVHAALYAGKLNYPAIKQTTGIQNLDADAYFDTSGAFPPLDEQRAIAAFLDRETERIDTLVAKKRQLIERLQEYRTALITRTVTRGLPPDAARAAGLDPSPRLKPSGVEWLGDVPEHWKLNRFSREVHIAEGQVDPELEPYASMLLVAPNHVESGTGRLLQRELASEQGAISGKYVCRAGDVIYSKIRPALAKVVVAPTGCLCSADMYPLRPRMSLLSDYLSWLLLSSGFIAWSVLEADRVAMPKINRETLNDLRLPVPPVREQEAINSYLRGATELLDNLVGRTEVATERLQEHRTALITAAVTGKIDVRELATAAGGPVE